MNKHTEKRFWRYVKKSKNCWEWRGGIKSTGRGMFWLNGLSKQAHRVSWLINRGEIPDGLCVLHHCDNGKCVRPDHLFLGSRKDNSQDMINKGRMIGNTKLRFDKVREIKSKYKFRKLTQKILAKEYGVTVYTIGRIIRNERKICV